VGDQVTAVNRWFDSPIKAGFIPLPAPEGEWIMALRHLIIAAMLAGFTPSIVPVMAIDKAEAAQTVKKPKKKKYVQKKQQEPRIKKNFRGPLPGEPNAGWTDDCLHFYDLYGRLPAYCEPYGHGFRMWDW
jgi:hypothetical protein